MVRKERTVKINNTEKNYRNREDEILFLDQGRIIERGSFEAFNFIYKVWTPCIKAELNIEEFSINFENLTLDNLYFKWNNLIEQDYSQAKKDLLLKLSEYDKVFN